MELAGETRSDARVASEGPRATGKIETGRSLLRGKRKHSGCHETILTTTSYETPSFNMARDRPSPYVKLEVVS